VPQTPQPISAASGPKFAILWGHVEEILLFKKFFRLSIHALVAMLQPDKVVRWCPDGEFLAIFCVLYLQQAACYTFQTCIISSHQGHIMFGSVVDIQFPSAENRRGKKKELECGPMPNVMAAQRNIGGALSESSVIPFLVPRRKVWLTPLLECRAVTLPL